MDIKMHSIRFDADQKLLSFIDTKVKKLPVVYDDILGAEIFLRLDKDTSDRENKLVEIKLDVKGQTVFAKKQCKTFEEARQWTFGVNEPTEFIKLLKET